MSISSLNEYQSIFLFIPANIIRTIIPQIPLEIWYPFLKNDILGGEVTAKKKTEASNKTCAFISVPKSLYIFHNRVKIYEFKWCIAREYYVQF